MATYEYGNMWDIKEHTDLFLITTNSYIKKNGAVVMGKGIAKTVKDKYPGIDKVFGELINSKAGHLGKYGMFVNPLWPQNNLGIFQVKFHFRYSASMNLIKYSIKKLLEFNDYHYKSNFRIDMNFPGIGNGRLSIRDVKPILDILPDNIHIWTFNKIALDK